MVELANAATCEHPGTKRGRVCGACGERFPKLTFADMGYLPDGQKRLPLNSAEEAQAAWRLLKHPGNVALYSGAQLRRIYARVVEAFERYGFPSDFAGRGELRAVAAAVEARLAELEEYRRVATTRPRGVPAGDR